MENFALFVLQQKIRDDSISAEDKLVVINDLSAGYIEFDPETDEPVGKTDKIEIMIDYMLN
ncbi:hypothetical protein [Neisseria iguanae]|uniref:hypothetical protein n=1 Tax=Neisseria iguanae TaxID=90242 RepID=UPI001FE52D88|nr:hypothetical protein [Neisseria iguanae]